MKITDLFESIEDWDDGVWVHYTDHHSLSMRYDNRQFHQDPAGIYFFPEKFTPWPYWLKKKYCFKVKLQQDIKILDISTLNEDDIKKFVALHGVDDEFNNYIRQYPPENAHKMMRMAWEVIRRKFMMHHGKWNAILRKAGWDAIFDDTGTVMSNEVQLIVLNPRIIQNIERITLKSNPYENMIKAANDLKDMVSEFGEVSMESPRLSNATWGGKKELKSRVEVKSGEKYASFGLTYNNDHKDINVHLSYSNPRLNYGTGITYSIIQNKYNDSSFKNLRNDMVKIFGGEYTE